MTCCWADHIVTRDPKFKDTEITNKQIENFIANQEHDFRHACEKKDSTGFGNLDDETAKEQLLEICRFWFTTRWHVLISRNELEPVLGSSTANNPDVTLNSDGVRIIDYKSVSKDTNSDSDDDGATLQDWE